MGRSFNGSSDKILATTVAASGSWTIACWAQANTTSGTQTIVYDGNDASNGFGIQSADGAAHVRGVVGTAGNVTSTQAASTTAFAHYALVNAAGAQTLYYNGASIGTASLTPVAPSGGNLSIGVGTTTNFFNGQVADVAVWNTNLSLATIQQLAAGYRPVNANSANLQGWWPLGGYQSPEADISGSVNNGVLTGTAQASMPPFISRGARSCNGSSSYLTTNYAIQNTGTITCSAWLNTPFSKPFNVIIGGNVNGSLGFGYDNSGVIYDTQAATATDKSSTALVVKGVWTHVLYTFTIGTSIQFYINGASGGSISTAATFNAASASRIGAAGASPGDFADGALADVATWNVILNSTQIANLAAGSRPPTVNSANLLGWWPLNAFSNTTESDLSSGANNATIVPGSASGPFPLLGPPQTWRLG
jgi:hypothetical protein